MAIEYQFMILMACLIGTFIFAGAETGFVSWNKIKINHLAENGSRMGKWGMYLNNKKNLVLSAILIGSNISLVGASISFNNCISGLSEKTFISTLPSPESWLLTPLIVLFCEMLPKSLFRVYSFQLTIRILPLLLLTYFFTWPLTVLMTFMSFGRRKSGIDQEQSFKTKIREEMVLVTAEGARTGALFDSANTLFFNILQLKNRVVSELMYPISDYCAYPRYSVNDTAVSIKSCKLNTDEIIIFDKNRETPVGYVTLLDIAMANSNDLLSEYIHPIMNLDQKMNLLNGLKTVIKDASTIFFVCNEKGKITGIMKKPDLYRVAFGTRTQELQSLFV